MEVCHSQESEVNMLEDYYQWNKNGEKRREHERCYATEQAIKNWDGVEWLPMRIAPDMSWPEVLHFDAKLKDGRVVDCHYACGGGEDQPRFDGWFAPYGDGCSGYYEVNPVAWRPKRG